MVSLTMGVLGLYFSGRILVSKTSDRGSNPRGPAKEHKRTDTIKCLFFCVASKLLCLRAFAGAGVMSLATDEAG